MKTELVLGGPGTGKTTKLLQIMERELASGVPPEEIAFASFTRAAVNEAKTRAMRRFGLDEKRLVNFRTIHSLCFHRLFTGGSHAVMRDEDYDTLSEQIGLDVRKAFSFEEDDNQVREEDGGVYRFLEEYARNSMISLEAAWQAYRDPLGCDLHKLLYYAECLNKYKNQWGKLDFTDMLDAYAKYDVVKSLKCRVAIIDEAQDLTPLQWRVVGKAFNGSTRRYIAGDDDQAIYRWNGADVDMFLNLKADRTTVLPTSYRLPRPVFDFCQNISRSVRKRHKKDFLPTEKDGSVNVYPSFANIDFSQGSWLIVCRNYRGGARMKAVRDHLTRCGYPFHGKGNERLTPQIRQAFAGYSEWMRGSLVDGETTRLMLTYMDRKEDAADTATGSRYSAADLGVSLEIPWYEHFRAIPPVKLDYLKRCNERGESIVDIPRIKISTVHGVKGEQAENVLVFPDVTKRTYTYMGLNPDDEHRVFYVAASRAEKNLHIVLPSSRYFYQWPKL